VHFYRIEFRRLDGDDFRTRWKEWYPWMLKPANPAAYSLLAFDSVLAAPDNYRLLYEDQHVRLLEVTVRPGETTRPHSNPYAAVLAFNTIVDEQSIVDAHGPAPGHAPAPSVFDMKVPTCTTVAAQKVAHTIRNNSAIPLHYYRIEFKRVDGDDFASHWRDWYPWMKYMKNMR
jgi:mannose-6-phosphate isomerase-like protein (cupin superfamily)